MAHTPATINGASGHIVISDSFSAPLAISNAFSSFLGEHGGSFAGFASAALSFADRPESGTFLLSGADTISAAGLSSLTASFTLEELTPGSTYSMTFGAAAGNASLTGAQKLSGAMFASPASASGGLASFGLTPAAAKFEMTGADTLAGASAEVMKQSAVVPAATTIDLGEGSKITLLPHVLKG